MAAKIKAMIIPVIVALFVGAVAVALIFHQPTKTKLTAAQERVADYADSTATARITADSLRAVLKTVQADYDTLEAWYLDVRDQLTTQAPVMAPAPSSGPQAAPAASEELDWESSL